MSEILEQEIIPVDRFGKFRISKISCTIVSLKLVLLFDGSENEEIFYATYGIEPFSVKCIDEYYIALPKDFLFNNEKMISKYETYETFIKMPIQLESWHLLELWHPIDPYCLYETCKPYVIIKYMR